MFAVPTSRPATKKRYYTLLPIGKNAKNGYAKIDHQHTHLQQHLWYLGSDGYPQTNITENGRQTTRRLHQMILPKKPGKLIDHINRDKLDNRTRNLRHVTPTENVLNSKIRKNNTSGYRGVNYRKQSQIYESRITHKGIRYFLGSYKTARQAAKAYNGAARRLHGCYAQLNKI